MAAAENKQLDVVLMNKDAWDVLSASGYLMDLSEHLKGDEALRSNVVVLESNQLEVALNEADSLTAETTEAENALEVTDSPLLGSFSGTEKLYLGIAANTTRVHESLRYLAYVAHP